MELHHDQTQSLTPQSGACAVFGPTDDCDGTGWNALMSPTPAPEPAAGTVRVPVSVSISTDDTTVIANDGTMWWLNCENEWRQLPPLPQPVEIPGTVESEE